MSAISLNIGEIELAILDAAGAPDGRAGMIRDLIAADVAMPGLYRGDLPGLVPGAPVTKVSVKLTDALRDALDRRRGPAELGRCVRGLIRASSATPSEGIAPAAASSSRVPPPPPPLPGPWPFKRTSVPLGTQHLPLARQVAIMLMAGQHPPLGFEEGGVRVRLMPAAHPSDTDKVQRELVAWPRPRGVDLIGGADDLDKATDLGPGEARTFVLGLRRHGPELHATVGATTTIEALVEAAVAAVHQEAASGRYAYQLTIRLLPTAELVFAEVRVAVSDGWLRSPPS